MSHTIRVINNKVWGFKVSEYGLEHGYLDYLTLSKMVGDCILNNNLIKNTDYEDWNLLIGDYDEEIYQYYIITDNGYEVLKDYTDEIVYYNEKLDLYLWGITHFGTSWDYVLTDIKLIKEE